ncbi:MAG TPA: DUF2157 domain-containing protein [Marmoricola sp.]
MSQTAPPGSAGPGTDGRPDARPNGPPAGRQAESALGDLVADWQAEGIITPEQGQRILARSAGTALGPATAPRMTAVMLEALGYLGGVVVVSGCVLLASLYWPQISRPAQVGVLVAAAVLLVLAGVAVPQRLGGVAVRVRSVLWAGGTGAFAAALAVYGAHFLPDPAQRHVGVLVAGGAAVLAAVLWRFHRVLLQQIVMMGLFAATAGTLVADFGSTRSWPGVAVWAVGLTWLALGWAGRLRPARAARALGAATAIFGTLLTTDSDAGMVLMLVTTVAIAVLAVTVRDLALLVVGAVGLLQGIPAAVNRWFPNSLVAALALLVVGGGLVGAAIWVARKRGIGSSTARSVDDH